MEVLGYFLATLVGLSLGLIGGGGSILTLPILVYVMGIDAVTATSYSLFIVGITSFTGGIKKILDKSADFRTVLIFATPSILVVYATRTWLLPSIPDVLINSAYFTLRKSYALMMIFAMVMLAASISMIKSGSKKNADDQPTGLKYDYPLILLTGIGVGLLTGLVGAGGGFLIIPSLVLMARMPMKTAVGTSLMIIAFNSLIGFSGDLIAGHDMDWRFLLSFVSFTIAGMMIGLLVSKKIPGYTLKKGFGWFVLLAGIYIISKEILKSIQ